MRDNLLKMLRTRYTQLKTFLKTFRSVADIVVYTLGELAKNINATGFYKQTHLAASGIEYIMYTKNLVLLIRDQARHTNESDYIEQTGPYDYLSSNERQHR